MNSASGELLRTTKDNPIDRSIGRSDAIVFAMRSFNGRER